MTTTPPVAPMPSSEAGISAPAVLSFADDVSVLPARAAFLAASRARKQVMPGFILQARKRDQAEPSETRVRIGYTCSKKVGNAVARNRAKRRLREVARAGLLNGAKPGWDYVLIGRQTHTATLPFSALCKDLEKALQRIHTPRKAARKAKP